MKYYYLILISFFFICANAQWVRSTTNGPYGGAVGALAANDNYVFATTAYAGIFKSADNGAHWTAANNGINFPFIHAIAANATKVFAAGDAGIFESADNGESWILNNSIAATTIVTEGTTIFAGAYNGIFASHDDGESWMPTNNGLTSLAIRSLVMDANHIFAGTDSGGIFLSTDNGASWNPVNNGIVTPVPWNCLLGADIISVQSLAINGNKTYAGTNHGLYVSTDFGSNWTLTNSNYNGCNGNMVKVMAFAGNMMFFSDGTSRMKTTIDDGVSFGYANSTMQFVNAFAANQDHLFAAGEYGTVVASLDNGASWIPAYQGITAATTSQNAYGIAADGESVFAVINSELHLSTDDGENWESVSDFNSETIMFNQDDVYLGGYTGVYRSGNILGEWNHLSDWPNDASGPVNKVVMLNGQLFAAAQLDGIHRSLNNGISWSSANAGLDSASFTIRDLIVHDNTLFAATPGGIFRWDTANSSWVAVNIGATATSARSLLSSGNRIYAGVDYYQIFGPAGVFYSDDDGANWTDLNFNEGLNSTIVAMAMNGNTLIVAGLTDIYALPQGSSNWINFSDGLLYPSAYGFTINSNYIFATLTFSGVWKRPLSEIPLGAPTHKALSGSFFVTPNPMVASATLNCNSPLKNATLNIYNTLGQSVRQIDHIFGNSVIIERNNLKSGIYFIQVQQEQKTIGQLKLIID